jgi:hypothetical protein
MNGDQIDLSIHTFFSYFYYSYICTIITRHQHHPHSTTRRGRNSTLPNPSSPSLKPTFKYVMRLSVIWSQSWKERLIAMPNLSRKIVSDWKPASMLAFRPPFLQHVISLNKLTLSRMFHSPGPLSRMP